jgi:hypothetical protein
MRKAPKAKAMQPYSGGFAPPAVHYTPKRKPSLMSRAAARIKSLFRRGAV